MHDTYKPSSDNAEQKSQEYLAQRQEITEFLAGNTGQDFTTLVQPVVEALKEVRSDIAKINTYSEVPEEELQNRHIRDVIKDRIRQSSHDESLFVLDRTGHVARHADNAEAIIYNTANINFAPEDFIKVLQALQKLTADEEPLEKSERVSLNHLHVLLGEANNMLSSAIEAQKHGSAISEATAIKASAALRVLNEQLKPALLKDEPDNMQAKINRFAHNDSFIERHSNAGYIETLAQVKEAAPEQPKSKTPNWVKRLGVSAALVTGGMGLNQLGHETGFIGNITRSNEANVRTVDPDDVPPHTKLLRDGKKSPAERGEQNSETELTP